MSLDCASLDEPYKHVLTNNCTILKMSSSLNASSAPVALMSLMVLTRTLFAVELLR